MAANIEQWFSIDADGRYVPIPAHLVHDSYKGYVFYEAEGSYTALFTSNNWVNRLLKDSGFGGSLWTPFTFGIGAD